MGKDLVAHWETIYSTEKVEKLGWYEDSSRPSLEIIRKCNLPKGASILQVGAGASTLVDELIMEGYEKIIANDLSSESLEKLKVRLGSELSGKAQWIIDDLTQPSELLHLDPVDLWYDRAVLHFFTDHKDRRTYFKLLKQLVQPGGFVIIAEFNLSGATQCSGLPVYRYDQFMLQEELGNGFILLEAFDYTYTMPSGDSREYIYTLFQSKSG